MFEFLLSSLRVTRTTQIYLKFYIRFMCLHFTNVNFTHCVCRFMDTGDIVRSVTLNVHRAPFASVVEVIGLPTFKYTLVHECMLTVLSPLTNPVIECSRPVTTARFDKTQPYSIVVSETFDWILHPISYCSSFIFRLWLEHFHPCSPKAKSTYLHHRLRHPGRGLKPK